MTHLLPPLSPPRRPWLVLVAVAGLVLPSLAATPPAAADTAADTATDAYVDIRPDLLADVVADTGEELSSYVIDVTLDEVAGTLSGDLAVSFYNDTASPLNEVYFRLFPNIAYYAEGALDVSAVTVDGAPAATALEVDATALRVDLAKPVAAGETVGIALSFTTTVPIDATGSYGIFRRDSADGTWILADWFPILAVYEDGRGWHIDAATPAGDPTHAATALYDVTVTAPDTLAVIASGVTAGARDEPATASRERWFIAGPARDFTLVVDSNYAVLREEVDGVAVAVYTEADVAPEVAQETLDIAIRSLRTYGELFGPYPYTELDLVQTRLSGALAVSWSGLVFLDGPSMLRGMALTDPLGYETVVAHEVAHLWWGAVVGNNSNDHTFMNEGLATLSCVIYLEQTAGPEAAAIARDNWIFQPARRLLGLGDLVVDTPVAATPDEVSRAAAVYGKGALGFTAIRRQIGDEAFFAGLRRFAEDHQFDIATPDDLRAAFAAASGQNLDALWSHWFDEAAMTEDEIAALAE